MVKMVYTEIILGVLLVVAAAIYYSFNSFRIRRCLRNLPGPKPTFPFGNTLVFLQNPTYKYISILEQFGKAKGSVFKFYDGVFSTLVIVTDSKLAEYVLNSTKMIEKSNQYEYLHKWLGDGLLTSTGTKWKTHRRLLTPSFHFSILAQFLEVFENMGKIFIDKLYEEEGKPSVNIYPVISLCTLDIICEAAMGVSVNAQLNGDSEYVRSVKTVLAILIERNILPIHKWLHPFTSSYYKEKKALNVLHTFTNKVIDQKIANLSKKNSITSDEDVNKEDSCAIKKRLTFLDILLESNVGEQPLSKVELREEVDTFMFEGHDTTSSAIAFTLYSLAEHPDVQRKVFEEQRSIFGNNKSPTISLPDLQSMKYLELVIKETLRMYPSVPMIGRKVDKDFEWGEYFTDGVTFPKGLNLILYTYGIHRNADYFKEPNKFIPERFEEYSGKDPFTYVPFSAGPRNCIGQKFAMLEMKSTISKVVRHFELLPSSPKHTLQLALETILVSKNGVCVSLRKRRQE